MNKDDVMLQNLLFSDFDTISSGQSIKPTYLSWDSNKVNNE